MDKQNTMEYYSAITMNGVWIHVIIRMNLKIILVSKRSQALKDSIVLYSIYMKSPEKANLEGWRANR